MSKCISRGDMSVKGRGDGYFHGTGLLGLRLYWKVPLPETSAAPLLPHVHCGWHGRAVFCRHYLPYQGQPLRVRVGFLLALNFLCKRHRRAVFGHHYLACRGRPLPVRVVFSLLPRVHS